MRTPVKSDIRARLIKAAVDLSYQHGFVSTSLADIAKRAKVPVGNVYYYFKTKEAIANAIIEQRFSELLAAQAELGKLPDPRERLCNLVSLWLQHQEAVIKFGCPIGTFCTELNKAGGKSAQKASKIFSTLLTWVEEQFGEFLPKAEAQIDAVQFVSSLEGVTVLANSLKKPALIKMESARLLQWIRSL